MLDMSQKRPAVIFLGRASRFEQTLRVRNNKRQDRWRRPVSYRLHLFKRKQNIS